MTALSIGLALPATAQHEKYEARDPEAAAKKMTEAMTEKYGLRDDQREAVYKANLEWAQTMHENREQMKEQHQMRDERLKDILDEDQYARMKEHKMEQRDKRKGHRMGKMREERKAAPRKE